MRHEAVNRAVNMTGTLAAEDEVTVSSQAEGVVSRILADLGDRGQAGQVLVELDREKLQYSLDQQRAALARALARYGASEPGQLPPIEQTPDVRRAAAELAQAKQADSSVPPSSTSDSSSRSRRSTTPDAMLRARQAAYDSALQNARNLRADIDAADASAKLAERQLRDASIRAPFDGFVQKRLVSLGELVKAQTPVMTGARRSAEGDGRDPGADGAVGARSGRR